MKTTATNTGISFKEFIKNCYVEDYDGVVFNIIYNNDEEVYYKVDTYNGWKITEVEGVDSYLNDAQREVLFLQIDEVKEDKGMDTSDFEHPSIAGGIYTQTY